MRFCKVLFIVSLLYLNGCIENPPLIQDGNGTLELQAVWNQSQDSIPDLQPLANAKVLLNSQYGMRIAYTDINGMLKLEHLPTANYSISVRASHPFDKNIILVGAVRDVAIATDNIAKQNILTIPVSSKGISINEIYSCGSVNNISYVNDQFIELYNSSDSVKYLDGMIFMRVGGNKDNGGKGPGADQFNDGRIWGVSYIYKFPGKPGEKNYPFQPNQFLVLASSAIDHRKQCSTSIDLTKADWEFYNQYGATYDNPNVPNLLNLRPEKVSPFLINTTSDVVVLASGTDIVWSDGIDINSIIDAVEYESNPVLKKTIDERLDRGIIISAPKYSGKSIQRKEPGMDTNDGSMDWEIISSPTPGRQ